MALLILIFLGAAAHGSPAKECSVTHKNKNGTTEGKLLISKDVTSATYGIFQVKIESKSKGTTSVAIEANGMKTMQAGSGTTKATLSNGDERIEVVCR